MGEPALSMDMASASDKIRDYLVKNYLPEKAGRLDEREPLFVDGVLDSIHLVSVVIFLQETFHIRIHPLEISPENFCSLQAMAAFVQRKVA
jgi:acyl carrier protein